MFQSIAAPSVRVLNQAVCSPASKRLRALVAMVPQQCRPLSTTQKCYNSSSSVGSTPISNFMPTNSFSNVLEQQSPSFHTSLVQQHAPDFTADAVFPDDTIKKLSLANYRGKYVILFFYPLDFTFVCPSEILAFSKRVNEFRDCGCEVIGVSVDSPFSHSAWRATPLEKGGISKIQFPLVSDLSKAISRNYGVLVKEQTVSLRGLFLLDREGVVRHTVINDLPLGRSVDEALRMLQALQHFEKAGEVCPADWKKGSKAMIPSADGVAEYLSNCS